MFQFHTVQLKRNRNPGYPYSSGVSIPYGTIKTRIVNDIWKRCGFQFHTVQLKLPSSDHNISGLLTFQFHTVQLKQKASPTYQKRRYVSIPYGTIKT